MEGERGRPASVAAAGLDEPGYAATEDGYVAYRVFGGGPHDLLVIGNWASNIEVITEHPAMARYLDRLVRFARVICFDKRGAGLSDPVPMNALPTLEHWMDDARTVLDAVGSESAALLGDAEGGPMAMMFAATYPQRTRELVLVNTFARMLRADDYPIGMPDESAERCSWTWERMGQGRASSCRCPHPAWRTTRRCSAGPDGTCGSGIARDRHADLPMGAPPRCAFGAAEHPGPTLILHRAATATTGRRSAATSPSTSRARPTSSSPGPTGSAGRRRRAILDRIEEFLTGDRPEPATTASSPRSCSPTSSARRTRPRGSATGAGSSSKEAHDALVRAQLERYRGREIATTGDGFLAIFDGPARAVRCASDIAAAVRTLGIEIRAGLHSGEVELHDDEIAGIAVHIAARVMALAEAGRVLVSGTVKDLVVGSPIRFDDRGSHALRGVPGEWHLFEVAGLV